MLDKLQIMVAYGSNGEGSARGRQRHSGRGVKDGYVGQASWLSSNINLVNTIVGAGT